MDSEHFNQRPKRADDLPLFAPSSPGMSPTKPTAKKVPALQWYDVPVGTREASCRGCSAAVYWVTTKNDKKCPVDCSEEIDGAFAPSDRDEGRGVSHFSTCPKAAQFSGQGRRNG